MCTCCVRLLTACCPMACMFRLHVDWVQNVRYRWPLGPCPLGTWHLPTPREQATTSFLVLGICSSVQARKGGRQQTPCCGDLHTHTHARVPRWLQWAAAPLHATRLGLSCSEDVLCGQAHRSALPARLPELTLPWTCHGAHSAQLCPKLTSAVSGAHSGAPAPGSGWAGQAAGPRGRTTWNQHLEPVPWERTGSPCQP